MAAGIPALDTDRAKVKITSEELIVVPEFYKCMTKKLKMYGGSALASPDADNFFRNEKRVKMPTAAVKSLRSVMGPTFSALCSKRKKKKCIYEVAAAVIHFYFLGRMSVFHTN